MSLTAPYNNAMRIGQGFNTYTQEIRLDNAVKVGPAFPSQENPNPTKALLSPPITPGVAVKNDPLNGAPSAAINGPQESQLAVPSQPTQTPDLGRALDVISAPVGEMPFEINGPTPTTSQSVTYSTRAIENVSDIMDALNISTSMSIKYGTIHGNGNASFVNENKVLESELNYVVSVEVNNDARAIKKDMEFQDIAGLPLERFTEVYGDSFISGFMEGGSFNAIISIKLSDKSKYKSVKQAVDVQLAVGPPTLEIGASEAVAKEHSEALRNTEISISVNWVGGGEIKRPEVPWTIQSVVAVANAFPSMVARSSARTQAILTRYSSLRSFQAWKWARLLEEKDLWEKDPRNQRGGEKNKDGNAHYEEPVIILNYVPCSLYTAELFDALMKYKKLWKRIGDILHNPSQYKLRPGLHGKPPKAPSKAPFVDMATKVKPQETLSPLATKDAAKKALVATPVSESGSPCDDGIGIDRAFTFTVDEGALGWNLIENNLRQDPVPPEPVALNEARLLCRQSMTLITEEASRLVDHPHLAYAQFSPTTKSTRMKRPNYAYPEVLASRLPIPIHNDILSDLSTDGAYLKTIAFSRSGEDNLWFEPDMIGDPKSSGAALTDKFGLGGRYEDFSTLELTEARGAKGANSLRRIALHKYKLSSFKSWLAPSHLKGAERGVGALGFSLKHASSPPNSEEADGCTHHLGDPHFHHSFDSDDFKALDLGGVDVTKMEVAYVPGSGYISGVTFFDQVNGQETPRLVWRQWEGKEPQGLVKVVNEPPERGDGTVWRFAGLAGSWVNTMGNGHLLARLSGIWKRDGEE